jgi:hypothetical protein
MTAAKVDITKRYKTPKDVLRACLRLFEESPSNWTRHMRRRNRKTANGGIAFCAIGATQNFAADSNVEQRANELLRDALPGNRGITEVNDNSGRKVILAGLEKAIG